MNYIGMDTHITTLEFAVVNERGMITRETRIPTGAKTMIEFIRSVPKPRKVYTEEGSLAAWVVETCLEFGEEVVVTDTKRNRWIGSSEEKLDSIDAKKLAQLARGGYVKAIAHPTGDRRRFRELVGSYHDTVISQTRIKNKVKSKFRQNGILCTGETVYSEKYRKEWREKLKGEKVSSQIIEELWKQLDATMDSVKRYLRLMRSESKKYPEVKNFQDLPGVALVNAATISAILADPNRFAHKGKVWTYAGLGMVKRGSGEKIYSNKLNRNFNRRLKCAIKQSAQVAVSSKDNPFRRHYLEMTLKNGVLPHRAKLTIARKMLATMYGMWKSGSKYDPAKVKGSSKSTESENSVR